MVIDKYIKLKAFILNKISIFIAEKEKDYSSDYKSEMLELDNLKDILEFSSAVWKSIHWGDGSSFVPPLLEENKDLAEYSRILVNILIEEAKETKRMELALKEKEGKINSFQSDLSAEKEKLVKLEVEKKFHSIN